jgi:hypothetical protein
MAVLAYHVCMLLRREVASEQLPSEILRRSFLALLALLALGLTWFWPWYVLWLLPFASLTRRRSITVLMVAFTVSAFAIHWSSYYQTVVELLPDGGRRPRLPASVDGPALRTGRVDRRLPGRDEDAGAQASSGQLTGTRVVHSVNSWLALVYRTSVGKSPFSLSWPSMIPLVASISPLATFFQREYAPVITY